ncbi:hypothetical protein [Paracraurococcus lichenis]|uniref:Uncharacterized protein n=1 Tax=Paracraurococcus lichenis TaxID=3064888 RepID=A0ABT9E9A3_9PROT|nr:hypothetical protein [Paracraurococcus sp. LOR1-02]MDO9712744.1 hypothetical protein [Paracraurococcus sp. LOR1-02]
MPKVCIVIANDTLANDHAAADPPVVPPGGIKLPILDGFSAASLSGFVSVRAKPGGVN